MCLIYPVLCVHCLFKKGTKIGARHTPPSPNTLDAFYGHKTRKNPVQAAYQQHAGKMSRKLLLCVKSPWSSLTAAWQQRSCEASVWPRKVTEGHHQIPSVQIGAKRPTIWRMCMQVMKIKWEMLRRAFNLSSGRNSCGCTRTFGGEHVGCAMTHIVNSSPKMMYVWKQKALSQRDTLT